MVKSRYGYELKSLDKPAEGWLVAMCKAIGMSGSEVVSRMGLSRNAVYQAERNERDGAITINQMQKKWPNPWVVSSFTPLFPKAGLRI